MEAPANSAKTAPLLHLFNRNRASAVTFEADVLTVWAKSGRIAHTIPVDEITDVKLRKLPPPRPTHRPHKAGADHHRRRARARHIREATPATPRPGGRVAERRGRQEGHLPRPGNHQPEGLRISLPFLGPVHPPVTHSEHDRCHGKTEGAVGRKVPGRNWDPKSTKHYSGWNWPPTPRPWKEPEPP